MSHFTAACIQLNTQDDERANIEAASALIRQAAGEGADFIALPENAFCALPPEKTAYPSPDAAIDACEALAREVKAWILIGSVHPQAETGKSWNRSLLIDPDGRKAARYDKIHLFDATLKDGEHYSESSRISGGSEAVVAHLPWGRLGMTVCYDLRFPHLYRTLAQAGAEILSVPSAFTYTTGKAHWHALLRARAIENGCVVIAPAQCGLHPGKRRTYGHSLIVSPWGEILAEGSEDRPGIVTATINMNAVNEARAAIPSLKHDRAFGLKSY